MPTLEMAQQSMMALTNQCYRYVWYMDFFMPVIWCPLHQENFHGRDVRALQFLGKYNMLDISKLLADRMFCTRYPCWRSGNFIPSSLICHRWWRYNPQDQSMYVIDISNMSYQFLNHATDFSRPQPSHVTLASIRRHKSVIKSIVVSKGKQQLDYVDDVYSQVTLYTRHRQSYFHEWW